MKFFLSILAIVFLCAHANCYSQDSTRQSVIAISPKYFDKVSKKADNINSKIDVKTAKALNQLQKRQDRIRKKLFKIDSLAAKDVFANADQRIKNLENKLKTPQSLKQYIPFLDTLKSSLKFLEKNKALLANAKGMEGKMDGAMDKVNGLEDKLQQAAEVKKFLNEQKQYLKDQLLKFGFAKQLGKINKDVYYYGQQINQYKEDIKDPEKIERRAIAILNKTKPFQEFMKKNSMLASLFSMPSDDPMDPAYVQSLAGLQTRAQVTQLIQNQLGSASPAAMQQVQANISQAQSALQQLKAKAMKYGNGANDGDVPDFKPNSQKTKSFLHRLEYGTNIQTQKTNNLFPLTSDIAGTLGYRLSDKIVSGIGASYKMGWGESIKHIKLTNQGVGLRSYLEIKYKKSLWITGGFEMNYRTLFNNLDQLKQFNAWSKSGLLGITKKLPINTKFFKNSKLQLLWDFLSYQQVPRTQPIVFRVGYNIK